MSAEMVELGNKYQGEILEQLDVMAKELAEVDLSGLPDNVVGGLVQALSKFSTRLSQDIMAIQIMKILTSIRVSDE